EPFDANGSYPFRTVNQNPNILNLELKKFFLHSFYPAWVFKSSEIFLGSASDGTGKKKGRTVTLTTDDMQKRKNDVKARTTLLLALFDKHQLRFSKYKTAQELWAAILKTFDGNEATKKTKKNLLKQQYGNFKAEGSETLEQTFNILQVIVTKDNSGNEEVNIASVSTASSNVSTASANIRVASISQDTACAYIASQSSGYQIKFEDINQIDEDDIEEMDIKWNMALLSMRADRAPRSQDKGRRESYRQGSKVEEHAPKALMEIEGVRWDWSYMANDEENHALVADEEDHTEFALMAKTSAESEIDEDDMEEMDIKWNTVLLSMRAEKFWKRTGKKISIQGSDVAGFDKSKVKCFNCHKMGHFVRECRAPRNQEKVRKESYRQGSKAEKKSSKALMAIDGVG
nr:ribonuclease H-like domain-containing protein [Tanacetum cinerariifolium]